MSETPLPSYRSLLRELFWTRTGLLVLATGLLGIALLVISSTLPVRSLGSQITFAVGTGLLAAIVFTLVQTATVATAANRVLVEALSNQTRITLRALFDESRSINAMYLPTHIFEGSSRPDPAFNRQLTRDLASSQIFLFRGLSARHSAVRLLAASSGHWEFRAVIADPRAHESLHERVRYLTYTDPHRRFDDIYDEIKQQVRYGLVGLYLARLRCSGIFLSVTKSPSLDRFEIFDDSVWVTLFSDASRPASTYPRALRFGRSSFVYTMQRRDFQRATADAPTHVIEPSTTEAEFVDLFERLTGDRLTFVQLAKLQEDFNVFRRSFMADANLTGESGDLSNA